MASRLFDGLIELEARGGTWQLKHACHVFSVCPLFQPSLVSMRRVDILLYH